MILRSFYLIILLIFSTSNASAELVCYGKVTEVENWSGEVDGKLIYRLSNETGNIRVKTANKEQSSMILMAYASGKSVMSYWSCSAPPSCNESNTYSVCGYVRVHD